MRLSTRVTPDARHAARSASSRSAHDRTVPLQNDLTTVRFDGDATCVDLGGPPEPLLDLPLDLDRRNVRPDFDAVAHALDAAHAPNRLLRLFTLVVPLDIAFESYPPIFDEDLDL